MSYESPTNQNEQIIWTHSGNTYCLGYAYDCYGIFLKASWDSGPVAAYPGNDEGWEEALAAFKQVEKDGWVTVIDHH